MSGKKIKAQIKALYLICLIVIAVGSIALTVPDMFGFEKPFLLILSVGICDIAAGIMLVFASIKFVLKK